MIQTQTFYCINQFTGKTFIYETGVQKLKEVIEVLNSSTFPNGSNDIYVSLKPIDKNFKLK